MDPSEYPEPWRTMVAEILAARKRFERAVNDTRTGPLQQRLADIRGRIDDAVIEADRIAQHGMQLARGLQQLEDPQQLETRLAALHTRQATNPEEDLSATIAAVEGQLQAGRRIAHTAEKTRKQLQLLDVRLDEAVARAVELALHTTDPDALGQVRGDVDNIVGEMEALRGALAETDQLEATA